MDTRRQAATVEVFISALSFYRTVGNFGGNNGRGPLADPFPRPTIERMMTELTDKGKLP